MATLIVGMLKMGNIVSKARIEPTSLAFRASVLTITLPRLPDITILPTASTDNLDTYSFVKHLLPHTGNTDSI